MQHATTYKQETVGRHLLPVFFYLLPSIVCLLTLWTSSIRTASAAPSQAPIDPAVAAELDRTGGQVDFLIYFKDQADLRPAYQIKDWAERGRFVYHTLTGVAESTQPQLQTDLATRKLTGGVSRSQSFWIVNLIAVRGNREAVLAAASYPEVARILAPDKLLAPQPIWAAEVSAPEDIGWNIQKIRANQVWTTYGITGTGIVVANIDTGVDYTHPALVHQYRGNLGSTFDHNYNWWEPGMTILSSPHDGNSHGTHVMGIEAGSEGDTNQIGVAPGARWISAFGCCPDNETLLYANQWILAPTRLDGSNPDPTLRPHVVQNSWGGPGGSLIFNAIIEAQRAAGIFPSFAAGNEGSSCGTLNSPGDNPAAFNVGAVNNSDQIASFSSRGPNPFSGEVGPSVVAPGVTIRSSVPGGSYASGSGTSMAGPHVAGVAALLFAVESQLIGQVDLVEEIIRKTAVPLTGNQTCGGVSGSQFPNNTYGWGRIDAKAAADLVWHAGTLVGGVAHQTNSDRVPIAGATVSVTRNGYTLTQHTDSAGQYRFIVGAGDYDVNVEAFGFQPDRISGLELIQNGITSQDFTMNPLSVTHLSGVVSQQTTATGLPATIALLDTPLAVVQTDPWTGVYSTTVPLGSYMLRASAEGHLAQTVPLTITGDITQNFILPPTPDYLYFDNVSTCPAPFRWLDATAGGNPVTDFKPNGDDGYRLIDLPPGKRFSFYGNTYTSLYVGTNGFISFGQGYARWHGVIPFVGPPNNVIFGLGEDLNPANGTQGTIWTRLVENRWFVIEYDEVQHWSNGNPETFEIILDLVNDGIKLQYQQVSWPDFTSVGLESQDGSRGLAYSLANSAQLVPGRAVVFYPFTGRRPPCTSFFPDFNTDDRVDVIDVQAASARWNVSHANAAYDPLFDLNSDGVSDATDLQLVATHWLQPSPF